MPERASDSSGPHVSVVVATRNRRDAVLTAVDSILAQRGVRADVRVYDDASDDDTVRVLRDRFPGVEVTASPGHVERIVLRNRGLREARHPYVLVLDDDCYFTDPGALRAALDVFDGSPRVGVVALPIVEPFRPRPDGYPWCRAERGTPLGSFLGGASILRREAVLSVGGYRDLLVHHLEERDLGLRLLGAGWEFAYAGGTPLVHTLHPVRDKPHQVRVYAQNTLLVAFLNYPRGWVWLHMLASSKNMLFRSFRDWPLAWKGRGLLDGLAACWRYRALRVPVSREAYARSRSLPSHGPERYGGDPDAPPAPCRPT